MRTLRGRPTALKAFNFFKRRFPGATEDDVRAILGAISSLSLLHGAYHVTLTSSKDYEGLSRKEACEKACKEIWQTAYSRESQADLLLRFFGIDWIKYPDFDPVELSDSLNHDKRCERLFS